MELKELFEIQRSLDQNIEQNHNLQEVSLWNKKLLALQVELGELANETRCFKFWSHKDPAEKAVILEEYVDCLHFILSLGLEQKLEESFQTERLSFHQNKETKEEITKQFLALFSGIDRFRNQPELENYNNLLGEFFNLGEALGFSLEEVQGYYMKKNEINYQRQKMGY